MSKHLSLYLCVFVLSICAPFSLIVDYYFLIAFYCVIFSVFNICIWRNGGLVVSRFTLFALMKLYITSVKTLDKRETKKGRWVKKKDTKIYLKWWSSVMFLNVCMAPFREVTVWVICLSYSCNYVCGLK